jgi:hypothetical protein
MGFVEKSVKKTADNSVVAAILPRKYSLARDVYDAFWERYKKHPDRRLVLQDKQIEAVNRARVCQTKTLGYAVFGCADCGTAKYVYASCKHRFCARCGAAETNQWAEKMMCKVLNIKHSHIIMTLPAWLRGLAWTNQNVVFGAMFRVAAAVLQDYFEYNYGLKCGIVAVLHTAGSDLKRHPHLHLLVTWGGAAATGEIVELAEKYLMSHHFLARRWQYEMQTALIKCYDKGQLKTGKTVRNRIDFLHFIKSQNTESASKNTVLKSGWIVSIQPPLCDAESIVRYIGRYTKRACLSERKIVKIDGDHITIQYNDYKNTPRGSAPVQAFKRFYYVTFLDTLLQHVSEKGFQKVRYYGIYSSGNLKKLPETLRLPAKKEVTVSEDVLPLDSPFYAYRKSALVRGEADPLCCENCGSAMQLVQTVAATTKPKPALPFAQWRVQQAAFTNTS